MTSWAGYTDRYRLYCLAHGLQTPEAAEEAGAQHGYPLWIGQQWELWKVTTKHRGELTEADHAAFDTWLKSKLPF